MTPPSLPERLRSARIVRVGAVYLGASWIVLQIVDTLQGLLDLPAWVGPVAVVLLLVGLVVVAATAWVQSLPQTTAAEQAGEVPTDWEVAPADAIKSLSAGRLPHLTWGRALVGGVVALSLLFGFAGVAVLVRGPMPLVGPRAVGAEVSAEGIAVLPFQMSGEDLDVYREGMVALVATNLDGLSQYRAVDSRTVLARWSQEFGETAEVELGQALRIAGAVGARYAIVGDGIEAGPRVRLTAAVYDVADGRQVGEIARVEGPQEEILALVDALTVEVVRSILDTAGQSSVAQRFRLASLLTGSVSALRYYLEGDAFFRRARFEEARDMLQRAVAEDSTFALAHWRLGDTYGWLEGVGSDLQRRHRDRARALADRLPEREATLLEIQASIGSFGMSEDDMDALHGYIRRYPDDPDGWYLLGEAGLHAWTDTGISDSELEEALYKTVELDPTFSPYYEHALHWATAKGHEERYRTLLERASEVGDATERQERMVLRWALFQGDDAERTQASVRLSEMTRRERDRVDQAAIGLLDTELDHLLPLWMEASDRDLRVVRLYGEQGRLVEMVRATESADEEVLLEAVEQLDRWAQAGFVPEELFRRMDDAVGSVGPEASGSLYWARTQLDRSLGRAVDWDAVAERADGEVSEFLVSMAEGGVDTTGIREMVRADVLSDQLMAEERWIEAFETLRSGLDGAPERPPPLLLRLAGYALEAGQPQQTVDLLEGLGRSRQRTIIKFRLGRAYEELGDTAEALDAYGVFLSRAGPADERLGAVISAREAVARLSAGISR